jgi:hypothetical protein
VKDDAAFYHQIVTNGITAILPTKLGETARAPSKVDGDAEEAGMCGSAAPGQEVEAEAQAGENVANFFANARTQPNMVVVDQVLADTMPETEKPEEECDAKQTSAAGTVHRRGEEAGGTAAAEKTAKGAAGMKDNTAAVQAAEEEAAAAVAANSSENAVAAKTMTTEAVKTTMSDADEDKHLNAAEAQGELPSLATDMAVTTTGTDSRAFCAAPTPMPASTSESSAPQLKHARAAGASTHVSASCHQPPLGRHPKARMITILTRGDADVDTAIFGEPVRFLTWLELAKQCEHQARLRAGERVNSIEVVVDVSLEPSNVQGVDAFRILCTYFPATDSAIVMHDTERTGGTVFHSKCSSVPQVTSLVTQFVRQCILGQLPVEVSTVVFRNAGGNYNRQPIPAIRSVHVETAAM